MLKNIVVIGAGSMGNGIAHVFAQHQFSVTLTDVSATQLETAKNTIARNLARGVKKERLTAAEAAAILAGIQYTTDASTAYKNADLVIEAVSEDEALKKMIFKQLDVSCKENCILASNTSSIAIHQLAAATTRPERVIGMHFFNPVPVMPLVEIIQGDATATEVVRTIQNLTQVIGKTGVLARDVSGFVANRILLPMLNEAIGTLDQGVSDVTGIDTVMKLGMGHPMGPLELADFIGLDVCLSILEVLYTSLGEAHYKPQPLLKRLVAKGHLGKKSGRGFYDYAGEDKVALQSF